MLSISETFPIALSELFYYSNYSFCKFVEGKLDSFKLATFNETIDYFLETIDKLRDSSN